MTVAITSMASSLGLPGSRGFFSFGGGLKLYFPFDAYSFLPRSPLNIVCPRKNPRTVCGDCDGVLKMRGGLAVTCYGRPLIRKHSNTRFAHIDHRLEAKNHFLLQHVAVTRV